MGKQAIEIGDGKSIYYTLTSAVKIGDVVPLKNFIGIARSNGEIGDTITLVLEGVFEILCHSDEPIVIGDALYWDQSASRLTPVATDNIPAGHAFSLKGNWLEVLECRLGAISS